MSDAQAANQFRHAQRLEETYKRRIEDLLAPLVGPGRVRAQVVANLDFTVTEETRESFDPARTAIRSEQTSLTERRGSGLGDGGIPGALSNQPPETVSDDATQVAAASATSEALNSSRSSTRNFEVDRTISHVRPQPGSIRRLSVAVLVDDSPMDDAAGDAQSSLSDSDVERFTSLIKEAVGFDEARGDTVVVMNAAFRNVPDAPALEEPKFWEKPALRDTMKQVLGVALVLILAFGIVRPMLRSLIAGGPALSGEYIAAGGGGQVRTGGGLQIPAPNYDEKVAAAKNMAGHDPARVAAVVRKWVTVDG
jgi:flagellar M-ring protein FliF